MARKNDFVSECPKTKSEDGKYIYCVHYHSHYEDDDAEFVYYDANHRKFVSEFWTSAYAMNFYDFLRCDIDVAVLIGHVDIDNYFDDLVEYQRSAVSKILDNYFSSEIVTLDNLLIETGNNRAIPVTVFRGRKYKNTEGWLIDAKLVTNSYTHRKELFAVIRTIEGEKITLPIDYLKLRGIQDIQSCVTEYIETVFYNKFYKDIINDVGLDKIMKMVMQDIFPELN